jgi:hypothetical protein
MNRLSLNLIALVSPPYHRAAAIESTVFPAVVGVFFHQQPLRQLTVERS